MLEQSEQHSAFSTPRAAFKLEQSTSVRDVHLDGVEACYLSAPRLHEPQPPPHPAMFSSPNSPPCQRRNKPIFPVSFDATPQGSASDYSFSARSFPLDDEPADTAPQHLELGTGVGAEASYQSCRCVDDDSDSDDSTIMNHSFSAQGCAAMRDLPEQCEGDGTLPCDTAHGGSPFRGQLRSFGFGECNDDDEWDTTRMSPRWERSIMSSTRGETHRGSGLPGQVRVMSSLPVDVPCGVVFGLLMPLMHGWHVRLARDVAGESPSAESLWLEVLECASVGQLDAVFVRSVETDELTRSALEHSWALEREASGDAVRAKLGGSPVWKAGLGVGCHTPGALSNVSIFAMFGPCLSPGSAQALLTALAPHGLRSVPTFLT